MKKIHLLLLEPLAAAILFFVLSAYAQDDFSKIQYKVTTLTPSLHMLEGAGGNITASIGPDGVLLVDDDFADMSDKLLAKLKELKGDRPRFIVNTHFHYDHSGGNVIFGPLATIIAAPAVRTRLSSTQTLWKQQHPALPANAWPQISNEHELTLHFNNENIRVVHLPNGHTDGDTVVFFNNNKVVSVGDLYFSGMFPIFHPEHKGSLKGYVKNIETLLKQISQDTKIIPGHGPLSNKSEFETYHRMIVSSIAAVQAGIDAGWKLEKIQKTGLPAKWEPFCHGYATTERWIAMIYEQLTKME